MTDTRTVQCPVCQRQLTSVNNMFFCDMRNNNNSGHWFSYGELFLQIFYTSKYFDTPLGVYFGLNNVYKELIGPNGNVIRIPIEEHEISWDMFKWIEYFKNSEILS